MSRIRTFVAIDLGKRSRSRCAALAESLPLHGVRWAAPETLHVTLAFLGDVEDRELARVCRAVADGCAGHPQFAVTLEGLGCFPSPKRARSLWVGVGEGADELTALQASIEAALVQTGLYRAEERPFTPHVTLGRARTPGDFSAVVESHARWSGAGFDVTEVLVMSSELRPEGPEHAVLGRVPL